MSLFLGKSRKIKIKIDFVSSFPQVPHMHKKAQNSNKTHRLYSREYAGVTLAIVTLYFVQRNRVMLNADGECGHYALF